MKSIKRSHIYKIKEILEAAPHGKKTEVAQKVARDLGMSHGHLMRLLAREFGSKRAARSDKGTARDPRIEEAVKKVAALRASMSAEEKRTIPVWQVIKICEDAGDIPAGLLTAETAYRLLEKNGVTKKKKCVRIEPEYINRVVHVDGSGSEHWYVSQMLDNGDALLRSRFSHEKTERNRRERVKPRRNDKTDEGGRPLVYLYSMIDGHTRYTVIDAFIAESENAHDNIEFLDGCWSGRADGLWRGVPEEIVTDNGPFARSGYGAGLCRELEIELTTGKAYNKRQNGKVERSWRTLWASFEMALMMKYEDILFSEYKRELAEWSRMNNTRTVSPSIYAAGRSRERMAMDGFAERAPRLLPEGVSMMELAHSAWNLTVDQAGRIRHKNKYYEVIDCPATLLNRKVNVKFGLDGQVRAWNPHKREWMDTMVYVPLGQGEYRSFKRDANDDAVDAAAELKPVNKLPWNDAAVKHGAVGLGAENVRDLASAARERTAAAGFDCFEDALAYVGISLKCAVHELPGKAPGQVHEYIQRHYMDRGRIDFLVKTIKQAIA